MQNFDEGQGFVKAGFLGFSSSGKTFTATQLAIQIVKHFKSKKPIAFFDTEAGAVYVNGMVKSAIGKSIIGEKSRSLADLLKMAQECAAGASDVLIVDSITHVWREICDAYLKQVNEARANSGRSPRQRLEFQDWSAIKSVWAKWTEFYLNSPMHVIICGRAGYEYDFEEKEDATGNTHKELIKTGIKMKVEGETAFEPSLLVSMERGQVENKDGRFKLTHSATILKDRFNVMDGATCEDPDGAFFMPFLNCLTPGALNTVDTAPKTEMGVDEAGDAEWQRERKQRVIQCEKIAAIFEQHIPGRTAEAVKRKHELSEKCFGTTSWTEIENTQSAKLIRGKEMLLAEIAKAAEAAANAPAPAETTATKKGAKQK